MTLPTTNIKFSELQTEFGGSNPISLSEYVRGGSYVPSGTTSSYGTIPTSNSNISLGVFRGTQKSTVLLNDHVIEAWVGSTFSGTASTWYIFWGRATGASAANQGKAAYFASVAQSASPNRKFVIDGTTTSITQSTAATSGSFAGEWLLSGNPGDYEVRFTQLNGFAFFSGSGSFNTWLTLDNGSDTSYVIQNSATQSDNFEELTVQIRDVATQTIQDTATIYLESNGAGIN